MEIIDGEFPTVDIKNENILRVEKVVYPMGEKQYICIWGGVQFKKTKGKVKKSSYLGGYLKLEGESLHIAFTNKNIKLIDEEEYNNLIKEVRAIAFTINSKEKEQKIKEFVQKILDKYY